MKKTIVVYGSSTGTCEGIANEIASKLGTEAISVSDLSAEVVTENENLILGTSTWGAGEVQDDWYDGIKVIKGADLSGKTVALFGCGDSSSYSDTSAEVWLRFTMPLRLQVQTSLVRWMLQNIPLTTQRPLLTVSSLVLPSIMTMRMTRQQVASMHGLLL